MIYTVGNRSNYDKMLAKGKPFLKLGKDGLYPGGFAFKTVLDAAMAIEQFGKDEWAVYEVDADWEKDTVPSETGWWHALVNNSIVIRRVGK